MLPSSEEIWREYKEISDAFRERIARDPEEAKAFLLRAGILTESDTSPNGVRLADKFCSEGK